MERFVAKATFTNVLAAVMVYFWDALIVWWLCGVLLPVFPALACLAGLTYWDWVGICFGFQLACRWLTKVFKAVWG